MSSSSFPASRFAASRSQAPPVSRAAEPWFEPHSANSKENAVRAHEVILSTSCERDLKQITLEDALYF